MASRTWWTWIWVDSGSWWWTGRPGLLWFMGSQRVRHNLATELNWTELKSLFLTSGSFHSKGFPGLSFFLAWHSRHSKNTPGWGPSLLLGASGTQRAALSGVFLLFSCRHWHGGRERDYSDVSTPCVWLSSITLPP